MTIPPHTLAKKIIEQCPELNISESQLGEAIETIMVMYRPFIQPYGTLRHSNEYDRHIAKTHSCSFCGNIGMIYHGYKLVNFPYSYLGYLECKICKHCDRL